MESHLNTDVLSVIAQDDPFIYAYLIAVSKGMKRLVESIYNKKHLRLADTKVILRFTQALVRDLFFKMPEGTIALRAEKSYGKTYTGYAALDGLGVVMAPKETSKVWVNFATNMGWYHANPSMSKVLCISDVAGHKKYAMKAAELITRTKGGVYVAVDEEEREAIIEELSQGVVIIVRDVHRDIACTLMKAIKSDRPKVLVIDEAHDLRNEVRYVQIECKWRMKNNYIFSKQLLLSAYHMSMSHILGGKNNALYRHVRITESLDVPEVEWHVELTTQDMVSIAKTAVATYYKVVFSATERELDEIAYYGVPDKDPTDKKSKRLPAKTFLGSKLFYQKSGVKTIPSFNEYNGNAILLMNSIHDKGVNVHADGLYVIGAGHKETKRVIQAAGRVVRTGNDVDVVHVHLIAENEHSYLRSHYARCHYVWKGKLDKLPTHDYLRKCVSILKLLGTSVSEVNQVDGCIIFANTLVIGNPSEALKWWDLNKSEDSILSRDMVKDILCM